MLRAFRIAEETVRAFCRAWFEDLDLEEASSYLAPDVDFIGTGENEFARGRAEMRDYMRTDMAELDEPFACAMELLQAKDLGDCGCELAMALHLKNSKYTWRVRGVFFLSHRADKSWEIRSICIFEPSRSQQGEEHYPGTLVMEHTARQRQQLVNDSLMGGMLGGYLESGFPFYFINSPMLKYLGYASEREFVEDIGGLVANCIHPADREMMGRSVRQQLAESGEYAIEHRMKKKDGSYIWVHGLGRRVLAADDREAVMSVCIDITEQKQTQEEVDSLYSSVPGAIFRCRYDSDLTVLDANDNLYRFLGYTREEFAALGNRLSAVIYPDDLSVLLERLKEQLGEGDRVHSENRLVCKNGAVKWINVNGQLFREAGKEPFFLCVFVDATEERRLQERASELYEKELSHFAELASADGSQQGRMNLTNDLVESYQYSSPLAGEAAVAAAGDTYSQAVERLADSLVDTALGEEVRRRLGREQVLADYAAGKGYYHFECLRRRSGGSLLWSSISFRTCQNPETRDVIVFFHALDVTEKKLREQLLERLSSLDYERITEVDIPRDSYRLVVSSAGGVEVQTNREGFRQAVEHNAQAIPSETERAEYLEKLSYPYLQQNLLQQDAYAFSAEMREADGALRVKRFRVFFISRELGRACVTRTDVTDVVRQEQRQNEELAAALVAAEQANAAKSDFLSRMSHEIRTPMNAIIGMSAIAAQCIGDDEQVADCIAKIGISSRFLLSLINDILDMSRIESGKMLLKNERIPTVEFFNGVNSICYNQAAAKGVEYECIVDPVLDDYYMGDAMKLQQVLLNILSNAIKFTAEGGKVTFSVSQRSRTRNAAGLRFIVNDTGVGMSEDFLPHIFEPFSQESGGPTAAYGGTGLGLAISKNIVDLMDGKIAVRSIKGVGTEFTVDVKLGISEEGRQHRRQKKHAYDFAHLKTLVVDDDVAVCESAVATLGEMGVTAEWVDSGRKAIERVTALWDAGKFFDMILIDWKMPEMDGIETARRIRAIVGDEVTIIIMTAYDWAAIEHEAKLAGVNMLMSKPMFKSALVSAFTKAMGEKEEQAARSERVEYDFTGHRVLLVEDNAINTEVAVMLLRSKGFAVETAENGLRAMELFGKSPERYYSAILMDIRMPIMDGLTAASNIRHLSNPDAATVPIIAMTANAFDDDVEKSKAHGMNAHLAKPIDPERLYRTLYDFIYGAEEG